MTTYEKIINQCNAARVYADNSRFYMGQIESGPPEEGDMYSLKIAIDNLSAAVQNLIRSVEEIAEEKKRKLEEIKKL